MQNLVSTNKQLIPPNPTSTYPADTKILQLGDISQLDETVFLKLTRQNARHRLSLGTIRTYQAAVCDYNRFLAEHGLLVNSDSLQRYFNTISKTLKPSTLNLRKYAIKKCIKAQFGQDNPFLNIAIDNVFSFVENYKLDRTINPKECLTENDVKALVEHAPIKTRLLIKFLFVTGLRVSEMIGIRLSDCEPFNGYVKLMILGKGNQQRYVAIPHPLFEEIRRVFLGKTFLFESRSGKLLSRHNVRMQILRIGEKLGFHVTPHALRHARASDLLLRKGFSLKSVSRYIGHSSTAITAEMYIHDSIDFHQMFQKDQI